MKKILAVVLALGMILSLCACDADEAKKPTTENKPQDTQTETSSKDEIVAKFEVNVVDGEGNSVKGVMVQLCKDTCVPAMTDENGIAVFNTDITDGYKLSVMSCPEGYEYTGDAEVYLEEGITEFTLEISKK